LCRSFFQGKRPARFSVQGVFAFRCLG